MNGVIISVVSNIYYVEANEKIYECNARGKFKKSEIVPVVGDKVELEEIDNNLKKAVISKILDRVSYIKRPKMANLTQLIFVISARMPKPDLLMLDKQLAFAEYLKIKPVIVINKVDLDKNDLVSDIEKIYSNIGYKVIKTNAKENKGIDELREILKNNISAFSGNSGVGKSTLINCLFKSNITEEGMISQKNKKGKNTTTAIRLYEFEKNSYIADTPGFSTFDIYEIEYRSLDKYFKEFSTYIDKCEYVGCTHIKEEICGIKQGIKDGKISKGRYDNFIKIYEDLKDREEHKW